MKILNYGFVSSIYLEVFSHVATLYCSYFILEVKMNIKVLSLIKISDQQLYGDQN